jgi:hypothetical protein
MFTFQSMIIYLCILKLYHARPCAHARLCMLFLRKENNKNMKLCSSLFPRYNHYYDSSVYFHLCHSMGEVAFGKLDHSVLRSSRASMFRIYSIFSVKIEAPIRDDTKLHKVYHIRGSTGRFMFSLLINMHNEDR